MTIKISGKFVNWCGRYVNNGILYFLLWISCPITFSNEMTHRQFMAIKLRKLLIKLYKVWTCVLKRNTFAKCTWKCSCFSSQENYAKSFHDFHLNIFPFLCLSSFLYFVKYFHLKVWKKKCFCVFCIIFFIKIRNLNEILIFLLHFF